jgi:hypothetical protein
LEAKFTGQVRMVHCNHYTGKALICYDTEQVTLTKLLKEIQEFQHQIHENRRPVHQEKINERGSRFHMGGLLLKEEQYLMNPM